MLSSIFEELVNDNKILLKYENLLKTLSDDRVMMVCYSDEWYCHDLTKEECLELSELFKELADDID